jgi:hypothetical protein
MAANESTSEYAIAKYSKSVTDWISPSNGAGAQLPPARERCECRAGARRASTADRRAAGWKRLVLRKLRAVSCSALLGGAPASYALGTIASE